MAFFYSGNIVYFVTGTEIYRSVIIIVISSVLWILIHKTESGRFA